MAKLRDLIGVMKDKASQGKAALLSKGSTLSLLRATSHDSFTPPTPKQLSTLLSFGDGSRATAATAIEILMDRLQKTQNSAVALKCLIAVHHIVKHGTFILQDQLSVYPASGGRNYLKLSNFRDNSSPISWELSSWVRWYAQYIEQALCSSRTLGIFLGSKSSPDEESQEERVSCLMNADLLRETDALAALVDEIGRKPDCGSTKGNRLVEEIENLVNTDLVWIMTEVYVRLKEFIERLGCLSFGEAVELVCELKRMEESKEMKTVVVVQSFWTTLREVKEKVNQEIIKQDDKAYKTLRRHRASDSDRFERSVLSSADYLRFPSGRLLL